METSTKICRENGERTWDKEAYFLQTTFGGEMKNFSLTEAIPISGLSNWNLTNIMCSFCTSILVGHQALLHPFPSSLVTLSSLLRLTMLSPATQASHRLFQRPRSLLQPYFLQGDVLDLFTREIACHRSSKHHQPLPCNDCPHRNFTGQQEGLSSVPPTRLKALGSQGLCPFLLLLVCP